MQIEKATYSYTAINDCIRAIKEFKCTVSKRAEHFEKLSELKKLYDLCYEKTNCVLFDCEWSPLKNYQKAVNEGLCERTRKVSKKEYDELLKRSFRYLKSEIHGIYICMENGEVNIAD